MKMNPLFRLFLLALVCFYGSVAFAQWQWLDKDGRKVFSDRAPPAEIPQKNILKQPGGQVKAPAQSVEADAADGAVAAAPAKAASAAPGDTPKVSSVDKDLEAKKKQAEAAEAAKLKAEQEKIVKAKIENCARAKQAKTTFDSGVRVATTNAAGERVIMDDAARASEARRVQSIIDSDCR
jgi:hypothetical protein